ncbi:hypothetical protein F0919_06530 [Taibaiella lutea]|uniref:Addiction module protein n=1 Tax=Taibaiella lutea TaxID=2608001 RepID=A0A5M6CWP7_9BACT|nr:hypothetical protein [Taibaiella lutea]KAA5537325.1 hypothetical protein F0919_06530 [Taibaiella lutea]
MKNTARSLDKEINQYLGVLTIHQKEALLAVAKTFALNENTDVVYTDEFVTELNRRSLSLEDGSEKGYTWEEVKQRAKASLKR